VAELDAVAQTRIARVLSFLAVAGGAALLSRRRFEVLAIVGEIEPGSLIAVRHILIATPGQVVHAGPEALIADIGEEYRLYVRVPEGSLDRTFADRTQRAVGLLNRFVFFPGPTAPRLRRRQRRPMLWCSHPGEGGLGGERPAG